MEKGPAFLANTLSLGFSRESLEWGVVFRRNELEVRAGAIEGKREVPERCLPPSSLCCSDVFCASHYIHQGLTACVLWPS